MKGEDVQVEHEWLTELRCQILTPVGIKNLKSEWGGDLLSKLIESKKALAKCTEVMSPLLKQIENMAKGMDQENKKTQEKKTGKKGGA